MGGDSLCIVVAKVRNHLISWFGSAYCGDDLLGCVGDICGANDVDITFSEHFPALFNFCAFQTYNQRDRESNGLRSEEHTSELQSQD